MDISDPRGYELSTTERVVEIRPRKKFRPVWDLNP